MGKIKNYIHDFLEGNGFELGYDWDKLPNLKDFDLIIKNKITYDDYKGVE